MNSSGQYDRVDSNEMITFYKSGGVDSHKEEP